VSRDSLTFRFAFGRSEALKFAFQIVASGPCLSETLFLSPTQSLTQCYQQCDNQTEPLADVVAAQQSSLNASFQLYCRDSRRLLIRVESDDVGHVGNEKFIYLLVIRETQNTFADHSALIVSSNPFLIQFRKTLFPPATADTIPPPLVHQIERETQFSFDFNCFNPALSARSLHCQADEQQIELRDLKPSESYNISVTIISSSHEVRHLGTRVFTTLREDYRPENVTEVWVEQERAIEGDGMNVTVFVGWNPARGTRAQSVLLAFQSSRLVLISFLHRSHMPLPIDCSRHGRRR
jgi:hypothetical protein